MTDAVIARVQIRLIVGPLLALTLCTGPALAAPSVCEAVSPPVAPQPPTDAICTNDLIRAFPNTGGCPPTVFINSRKLFNTPSGNLYQCSFLVWNDRLGDLCVNRVFTAPAACFCRTSGTTLETDFACRCADPQAEFNGSCTATPPVTAPKKQFSMWAKVIPKERTSCGPGNPCNPATGLKHQDEAYYRGPGAFGLVASVAYNSRLVDDPFEPWEGGFGRNWIGFYERRINVYKGLPSRPTKVGITRVNGAEFEFNSPPAGNAFVADADITDRLERLVDGSNNTTGWRYTSADGDQIETYDSTGKLASIANRVRLIQTLAYSDGSTPPGVALLPDLLIRVTDAFGRQLNFTYGTGKHVATMTDPAGGIYSFAYDSDANLASVAFPDGRIRRYHYNEPANTGGANLPNQLTGITDENGARFATWTYDAQGRATSSEHANGVERHAFQYNPDGSAGVTDPLGVLRTYGYANSVSVSRNTSISGPPCPSCGPASQTYDPSGFPASRTDWNGNLTQYAYDARGLETLRVEAAGTSQERRITTEWHAFYRLALRIAEPLRITTYVYGDPADPNPGNRGSVLSRTVQSTADATGAQGFSATLGGTPRTWIYTYNANGQALTMDGPRIDASDVTSYTYYLNDDPDAGKRGNVATITNARGHVTQISAYDAHGKPLTIIDPNGLTTTLAYDSRQRLTARSVGGETTSYEYDGVGQVTKVTLPDGTFLAYTYDAAHRLTQLADNLGNRVSYTLDVMGNRTAEQVFDPANQLAQTRSRVYSSLNRLDREIGGTNPTSQITRFAYDNQGNVASITDPLNRLTANGYDALNRLKQMTDPASGLTRYGYDGQDQLASVTDPRNNVTTYAVDGLGNLSAQSSPDTGTSVNTYDVAGNLVSATDAKGQTTSYAYDALNRVTRIVYNQASGTQLKQVDYGYDQGTNGIGRLSSITESSAAGAVLQTTTYGYDQRGRTTSEAHAIGGATYTTRYAFDAAGRMTAMTYPSGRTVAYGLGGLGRVNRIETTSSGQTQVVVQDALYQPFGPPKGFTFGNLQSYRRTFDLDGRVASHSLASMSKLVSFDAASRITRIEQQGTPSNFANYGYDALDRVTSTVLATSTFSFGYDAVGNRTSKGTGASSDLYTYPATSNRLAQIDGSSTRIYAHDANGSIASDGVKGWSYDARGRLIASSSSVGTTTYQVNALGKRVRKSSPVGDAVFHYDGQGRLIAESSASGAPLREYLYLGEQPVAVATYPSGGNQCSALPSPDASDTFVPFARRERMEVHAGRPGERGWEWGLGTNTRDFDASARADLDWVSGKPYAFTLTYDGAGNASVVVRDGGSELFRLAWSGRMDVGNALRFSVRSPAGIGVGNRIALTINSIDGKAVSETLVTAGDGSLSQVSGVYAGVSLQDGYTVEGTVTLTFSRNYPPRGSRLDLTVTAGSVQCQGPQQTTPTLYYVHADHLNTPRAVTNQAQQLVWRWENQEPFGNNPPEENPSGLGSFEFPLRFAGQYFDRETNTAQNYFRDYDPAIGRFVQSDPIGLRGGINSYSYAGAAPTHWADPLGLCRIQVRFRPIPTGGKTLGLYHAYIVTTAPDGSQNYFRGGPGGPRNISTSLLYGTIRTNSGLYTPGTPDWDPGNPPAVTVLDNDEPCTCHDYGFGATLTAINNARISYIPSFQNSNSVVGTALRNMSIPLSQIPVTAPGFSTDLTRYLSSEGE